MSELVELNIKAKKFVKKPTEYKSYIWNGAKYDFKQPPTPEEIAAYEAKLKAHIATMMAYKIKGGDIATW